MDGQIDEVEQESIYKISNILNISEWIINILLLGLGLVLWGLGLFIASMLLSITIETIRERIYLIASCTKFRFLGINNFG